MLIRCNCGKEKKFNYTAKRIEDVVDEGWRSFYGGFKCPDCVKMERAAERETTKRQISRLYNSSKREFKRCLFDSTEECYHASCTEAQRCRCCAGCSESAHCSSRCQQSKGETK